MINQHEEQLQRLRSKLRFLAAGLARRGFYVGAQSSGDEFHVRVRATSGEPVCHEAVVRWDDRDKIESMHRVLAAVKRSWRVAGAMQQAAGNRECQGR